MAFNVTSTMVNGVAQITLSGELDAAVVHTFRDTIDEAAAAHAKHVALFMLDLEYMSSAGLRALVYAKQKLGAGVTISLIGVQEQVRYLITRTGFQNSVILLDAYDAAQIE
jgi:anti-anti-sigma factor